MRFADVVVAGAGPAGSACALTLARAGADVVLVEATAFGTPRIGETFSPAAASAVRGLGHDPCGHLAAAGLRSVWGSGDLQEHSYVFDLGHEGLHLDRARFDAELAAAAAGAGARLLQGMRVREVTGRAGDWRVRLEGGGVRAFGGPGGRSGAMDGRGGTPGGPATCDVRCRFVVDATGRAATVVRQLDGRAEHVDRLVATGVRIAGCAADAPVTLVEATADGWWYTTPLPRDAMVAVYLHDAGTLAPMPPPNSHTARRVARGRPMSRIRVSARTTFRPGCGSGWAATGDAATAVDPLGGDGILRAITDGIRVAAWIQADENPAVLAAERRAEQRAVLAERAHGYGLERRWATPFWAVRHRTPACATLTG